MGYQSHGFPLIGFHMKLRRFSLLALVAMVATLLAPVSIPLAVADGNPDIGLSKSMPDEVLLGTPIPVTLTLTNPGGPDGYNATFNDTLPAGVSYVPGSATPDPLELPQGDGTTVLVWKNVADILTNSTVQLNYCLLYTSPSPRDKRQSRMPSSA